MTLTSSEERIHMLATPEGADIQFAPGYGFIAPCRVTTNGSLRALLKSFNPDLHAQIIEFARFAVLCSNKKAEWLEAISKIEEEFKNDRRTD